MFRLSPVAVDGLQEISLLATFKEKLCRPFCIDSSVQPQVSIVYSTRNAKFNESTVFVPITATITVVTPCGKCNPKIQLFTENFEVAFQGQAGLPKAVKIASVGRLMSGADVKCGCAHSYKIDDSLIISIVPAALKG